MFTLVLLRNSLKSLLSLDIVGSVTYVVGMYL
jgi:hypothetical protein